MKTSSLRLIKHTAMLSIALLVPFALAACGDDEPAADGTGGDGGTGSETGGSSSAGGASVGGTNFGGLGGEGGEAPMPGDESLYAVVTQVFGTEGGDNFSYILTRESLAGEEFDLEQGIEIDGRALGVGPTDGGALYIATDQEPKVTRYLLDADGGLEKDKEVSFRNAGLSGIGEYAGQFQFVSDSQAYFLDGTTAQAVEWNPSKMTYTEAVDLSALVHPNELLTFGAGPIQMEGKLLAFPGWRTSDNLKVPARAAVVTIDTKTNEVEIATDDRCGYVRDGILADDGYIYLATEAYASAVYYMDDDNAEAPCLLRFDPKKGKFDASFHVDITTLYEGGAGGGSLVVGPNNTPFLLALEADDYAGPPAARVLASSPYWHFSALTLGDDPSAQLLRGNAGAAVPGSILPGYFGDEVIMPIFNGRDSTSFVELTEDGPGDVLSSTDGLAFSIVKLR